VRSTHAGSVVGGKRGTCLPNLVGGLSSLPEVKLLEQATITHDGSATLTWLGEALEYARTQGQTNVVGYLEAVLDDAVFEMESVARQ
jgi:hypothetical protein